MYRNICYNVQKVSVLKKSVLDASKIFDNEKFKKV